MHRRRYARRLERAIKVRLFTFKRFVFCTAKLPRMNLAKTPPPFFWNAFQDKDKPKHQSSTGLKGSVPGHVGVPDRLHAQPSRVSGSISQLRRGPEFACGE